MKQYIEIKKSKLIIGVGLLVFYIFGRMLISQIASYFIKTNDETIKIIVSVLVASFELTVLFIIYKNYISESVKKFIKTGKNIKTILKWVLIDWFCSLIANIINAIIFGLDKLSTPANQKAIERYLNQRNAGMIVLAILLAPVVEELLFRTTVFHFFKRIGEKFSIVITIVLFVFVHLIANIHARDFSGIPSAILVYLPTSFALTMCYYEEKNICYPIIIHMITNAIAVLVYLIK